MTLPLPRYVIPKRLAGGSTAFYFNVPTRYRKLGCTIPNEPLGNDYTIACGADGKGGRAAALNGLLDEWIKIRNGEQIDNIVRYGTVDWLFREYKASTGYLERVSQRSRPDYERNMLLLVDICTKNGDRVGARNVKSITPLSAEKLYNIVIQGPNAYAYAKVRKWLFSVGAHGLWCSVYIPMPSTRMSRILGVVLPRSVGSGKLRQPLIEKPSTILLGKQFRLGIRSQRPQP